MKDLIGVIIEESLKDKAVLGEVVILSTKVERVTKKHQTPWLSKWTLHNIEILGNNADKVANQLSKSFDNSHESWYADFKNENQHYIVFPGKIFLIDRNSKEQYDKATKYGVSIGIPRYQVDFSPYIKTWNR